jgi:hypothetical protein
MRKTKYLITIFALILCISGLLPHLAAAEGKTNLQALMAKQVPILLEFGRG